MSGGVGRPRGAAVQAAGPAGAAEGFWSLERYVVFENEVKKSKFLVRAWPVASSPEALTLIRGASDAGASHNCWAYRIGDEFRSSDDGEPGGSAGRPILAAIEGEGMDRVAVLVTRYFGGIKLGVGGLARAYGGAAKECLRLAPRVFAKAQVEVLIEASYDELGIVYGSLDSNGCVRLAEEYGNAGTVVLRAMVDSDRLGALRLAVADGTGGRRRVVEAAAAAAAVEGAP
ncbi:IMPACT family member in pol 5'region [Tetrabaena socialis]|uniref:IMPACT family member in pol 5'region n=1 Tax=Tetrabaena socialis TaxID=47790 RepID=A0A2J8AKA3_9CHLO|nr:IMPACT family member in pol 5'region [Tetrabaena socialis]|eukprot:PNH12940.1 IMPACT family member in pol 5'region [Tetrabaena socialis]